MKKPPLNPLTVGLAISFIASILLGSLAVYAALYDNPQGVFYDPDTGFLDLPYLALIFIFWFPAVMTPGALLSALVYGAWRLMHRKIYARSKSA